MFLKIATVVIVLFSYFPSWSQERKPTVVIIHADDGTAFVEGDMVNTMAHFEKLYPDHRIILVSFLATSQFTEKDLRRQILAQLNKNIKNIGSITHLFIATHGHQNIWSTTIIEGLGTFSKSQIHPNMREILDVLKPHVSPKLGVYFNSCATFCGTNASAKARAQLFLNYLGATEGFLFGAYGVLNVDSVPTARATIVFDRSGEPRRTIEKYFYLFAFHGIYAAVSTHFIFNIVPYENWTDYESPFFLFYLFSNAALYLKSGVFLKIMKWVEFQNRGRLFHMQNGLVTRVEDKKLPEDFISILSSQKTCKNYFY